MMGGHGADNFADDFHDAISEANAPDVLREMPPLHPTEKQKAGFPDGQWRNLAEETGIDATGAKPGGGAPQLLEPPKGRFKARFGRFDISDAVDCAELEKIQNNCLTPGKNWVLAREEWYNTKDGDVYVVVKYLEFFPDKRAQQQAKEEAERPEATLG